jgi:hypothetical protein
MNAMAKKDAEKADNIGIKRLSIHTNYRYISKHQMVNEIIVLREQLKEKERKIKHLEEIIEKGTSNRFITLDQTTHNDMLLIMQDHHQSIINSYPEESFQHVFWTSQYKAAMQKSSNGFRWNPAMIRWCVYLRQKSSKAYDLLRKSKCIYLPSERTLREYTHCINASFGFSNELDEQLINDAKISKLEDYKRHVCLLGDEMYIKEGLVYDRCSGNLVGYSDLGDINNHLLSINNDGSYGQRSFY